MQSFGVFLADWLRQRGWSQNQFALTAKVSQGLVSRWLDDRDGRQSRPSPKNLERIAPVLGMPYESLMRMCGYLPESEEPGEAPDPVAVELEARGAEMREALAGIPREYWATVLQATLKPAVQSVREYAKVIDLAAARLAREAAPTINASPVPPINAADAALTEGQHGSSTDINTCLLPSRDAVTPVKSGANHSETRQSADDLLAVAA